MLETPPYGPIDSGGRNESCWNMMKGQGQGQGQGQGEGSGGKSAGGGGYREDLKAGV